MMYFWSIAGHQRLAGSLHVPMRLVLSMGWTILLASAAQFVMIADIPGVCMLQG